MGTLEDRLTIIKRRGNSISYSLSAIRQAIGNGASSVKEIADQAGLAVGTVHQYSRRYNIELPKRSKPEKISSGNQVKRTLERDQLIQQGIEHRLTLRELGASLKLSHEGARQYLMETGKYEEWKEKKGEQKQEREKEKQIFRQKRETEYKAKQDLLSLLKERLYQKAQQEGWATRKAVEAFYARDRLEGSKYTIENIMPIFQRYEQAQKEDRKLSLVELAEGTVFCFEEVGRLLREISVEPMYGPGRPSRRNNSSPEANAIDRAYENVPMTAPDIAYFLDIPSHIVGNRFWTKGKRPISPPNGVKRFSFGKNKGVTVLTYRLASQIYEAADLGFNNTEVTELLETTPKVVEYALTERKNLEANIINALHVLYPEEEIKKPYRH